MGAVSSDLDRYARMAARSAERARAQAEKDEAERRRRAEAIALSPALPGESEPIDYDDEHFGHRTHYCRGATVCQCGATLGLSAFVPPDEEPPPCEVCHARGLGEFAQADPQHPDYRQEWAP
jgi:hypothetical protein